MDNLHPLTPLPMETNPPHNAQELGGEKIIVGKEGFLPPGRESREKFSSLNEATNKFLKERQKKKHIFSCPALCRCAMDIRPLQDSTTVKHAVTLVLPIRESMSSPLVGENNNNQLHLVMMNRQSNFVIWNVRGSNNESFRRSFRELVGTHKPCLVALLETKMETHASLINDFYFAKIIEVPAKGQSGGMAIL